MNVTVQIDGKSLQAEEDMTVAALLWNEGVAHGRVSVSGKPRGPLCGMGTCFECRVTIDGRAHQRSCLVLCREGMEVRTTDA